MKIKLFDELSETIVNSEANLNLKTGLISNVVYQNPFEYYNDMKNDRPFQEQTYEFTAGQLSVKGKNIDFNVDTTTDYVVQEKELQKLQKSITDLGVTLDELEPKKNKPGM